MSTTKQLNKWCVVVDRYKGEEPVYGIRRWEDGKLRRLPAAKYRSLGNNREELELFCARLNYTAEVRAKAKAEIRSAFLSPAFLEAYRDWLLTQVPREEGARLEWSYLRRHFLTPLINVHGLDSPEQWAAVAETTWARYLLSDKAPASAKSKRDVINAVNRFLAYLHKKRPDEVPKLELEPLSPAKFAAIEAQRELDDGVRETRLVTKTHWNVIKARLCEQLSPFVLLAYHYGLRRAELVGVLPGDVKKGHLSVERQLRKLGQHTYLKGKENRKVPHWYAPAADAYKWVESAQKHLCHPRTLSLRWDDLMKKLSLPYTLHDLRHTFLTHALRDHAPRDVQLAAGHKHLSTTMGYAHDDRDLSDEEFVPAS